MLVGVAETAGVAEVPEVAGVVEFVAENGLLLEQLGLGGVGPGG